MGVMRKFSTWMIAVLPLVAAILVGWFVPYSKWASMTDGLLVFLGLLVAALVQVIPVTANFLQADSLTVDEARHLSTALEGQQKYWLAVLGAAVTTAIVLLVGKAVPDGFGYFSVVMVGTTISGDIPMAISGVLGGLFALLFIRTFGIFPGVLSLQKLRGELVIKAAKRRTAERVRAEADARKPIPDFVPEDYGKSIDPPPH